jgi:hypothetical protein
MYKTLTTVLAAALFVGMSSAQADIILADDFAGVGKATNTATIASYDTQNGVTAALTFTARTGTDGTGAAANFEARANELDPDSRNDKGWNLTSSLSLDAGTQSISLTSLNLFALAVNSSGNDRHVDSNTPTTWTLSITGDGSYGTQSASVVDIFAQQPAQGTADPVIDLSSLDDLVAGENYTYRISMMRNSGTYMFVTLDSFSLEGDITPVPEPASLALVGLGGLMMLRRRK